MRPLRLLISLGSTALLLLCLLFLGLSSDSDDYAERRVAQEAVSPIRSLFSFHSPASLFSPTASISLTDDNSTYFAARPAAFGPLLHRKGLSGQVWIGRGFGDDFWRRKDIDVAAEGELGCGDVPGWSLEDDVPSTAARRRGAFHSTNTLDDEPDAHGIAGKIALLSRGQCGFSDKVQWAERRGAIAVIVGDNLRGGPLVQMYARDDVSNISIPSFFTSHTTAHLLSSLIPPDFHTTGSGPTLLTNSTGPKVPLHEGLWITLTLISVNASPLFNTLFVLVVSPLITLAVVYVMLLIRSRIRRRRWRAPKSVVERLPVRIYRTLSTRTSPTNTGAQTSPQMTPSTPLLVNSTSRPAEEPCDAQGPSSAPSISQYGSLGSASASQEKTIAANSRWRERYGSRQVECSVCLEEYEDGISKVMSLPCGHDFHADCITPWLTTRRRTCPICKGDVVRSLGQGQSVTPDPERTAGFGQEDVQVQAAETVNTSPSAALPLSAQDGYFASFTTDRSQSERQERPSDEEMQRRLYAFDNNGPRHTSP